MTAGEAVKAAALLGRNAQLTAAPCAARSQNRPPSLAAW